MNRLHQTLPSATLSRFGILVFCLMSLVGIGRPVSAQAQSDPVPAEVVAAQSSIYRLIVSRNDGGFFMGEAVALTRTLLIAPGSALENAAGVEIGPSDWQIGDPLTRVRIVQGSHPVDLAVLELFEGQIQSLAPAFSASAEADAAPSYLQFLLDDAAQQILADRVSATAIPQRPDGQRDIDQAPRSYGLIFNSCGDFSAVLSNDDTLLPPVMLTSSQISDMLEPLGVRPRTADTACGALQVAPNTPTAENTLVAPEDSPQDRRAQREAIEQAQRGLTELGFYRGPIDGTQSDALTAATASFALNQSLSLPIGVSPELLSALDSASVKQSKPDEQVAEIQDDHAPSWLVAASAGVVMLISLLLLLGLLRRRWHVVKIQAMPHQFSVRSHELDNNITSIH